MTPHAHTAMNPRLIKTLATAAATAMLATLPACEAARQNYRTLPPAVDGIPHTPLTPLTLNGHTVTLRGTGTVRLPANLRISGNAMQQEALVTLRDGGSLTMTEVTGTIHYSRGISVTLDHDKKGGSILLDRSALLNLQDGGPDSDLAEEVTIPHNTAQQ